MQQPENNKTSTSNPRIYYGYIIVTAAFFIMLAIYGINYSFGIFFKPIAADFGWTRAMTAGAFSTAWITAGIASIFSLRGPERELLNGYNAEPPPLE